MFLFDIFGLLLNIVFCIVDLRVKDSFAKNERKSSQNSLSLVPESALAATAGQRENGDRLNEWVVSRCKSPSNMLAMGQKVK